MQNFPRQIIAAVLAIIVASGCVTSKSKKKFQTTKHKDSSKQSRAEKIQSPAKDLTKKHNRGDIPSDVRDEHRLKGYASWYGAKFHGQAAADGEIYNMYRFTAAHKTLPFHTIVRVIDVETLKSVVVRIIDRGPFVEGRIIDLSYAAASDLGLIRDGIRKVRLEVLRWGDGTTMHGD